MKKIIYIIDNLRVGGAQIHLLRLSSSLGDSGYSVKIFSLSNKDEITQVSNDKLSIYKIPMDCVWKISFWFNFLRLIRMLIMHKPEIVHTYLNTANIFGVIAARVASVPIVISSKRDAGHFRSRFAAKLEKMTAGMSDRVICVSKAIKDIAIRTDRLHPDRALVIYNGVDTHTNTFFKIPHRGRKDYLTVTMAAVMDRKEKGHLYFIRAAEQILKETRAVKFTLIGDGELRLSLEEYIAERGLSGYFDFRGRSDDLTRGLSETDILVVPSESEGCSNVLLEAMSMGIPVIATAVEGNLEVIVDGVSGILVKPKDPCIMAERTLELIDAARKRKTLGVEARKRIEDKFRFREMVGNYNNIYTTLIEEKGLDRNKVGYIVSLFPCWSEVFILNELIELQKRGVDPTIFSIKRDREEFTQGSAHRFIGKTIYIHIPKALFTGLLWLIKRPIVLLSLFFMVSSRRHKNYRELLKYIWCIYLGCYFADIAAFKKLSHIHAHFATYPAFVAFVISRLTKIPFTFTTHAHDIFLDKTFLKELTRAAKEVVTISEYNKQYIADFCKNGVASKIRVIHCGIDLGDCRIALKKTKRKENLIISIGRLTQMKGFEYLIKACGKLKGRIPFKCYIIGDGPRRGQLAKLISDLGLSEDVVLKGFLDSTEISQLLKVANLFVLPSVWSNQDGQDGIPFVLMEAMAGGVPVIASKISGIPELIEDRKSGLLVEPKNEEILSQGILQLLNNKKLQKQFTKNARLKIERDFNINKGTELLLKTFNGNKRALRALFIIWSLEKGGAERFLVSLLKTIDRERIEPVVCCLNWKGKWAQELEDLGISVLALNKKKGVDFLAFKKLVKIIKEGNFDIVNTYLWGADVLGRLAAILAKTPVVISTAQNVDIWKKRAHRITDRLLARGTDKIIAVSGAVRDYYHKNAGIPLSKIATIPNAIELERFQNLKDTAYLYDEAGVRAQDFVLTCIGRLTHQKGQRYLLEAVNLLKGDFPQLRILFVGYGEEEESLKELTRKLNIEQMVRFLGYRKDIPQILHLSKGLVLPSLYEGLPVCVLEAMAAARPVIVTGVGGNSELVRDGENGFIVEPKDPYDLCIAIEKLINLPDHGKGMGKKAMARVAEEFSIQSAATKTRDLFLSLTRK